MKKIIPVLVFLFMFSGISYGQLDISFMAGVNSSDFRPDPSQYVVMNDWGYQAGVHFRVGGKTYFETGAQWLQSRNEFRSNVSCIVGSDEIRVTQVRIPAYIGRRMICLGVVDLRVNTGPTIRIVTDVLENNCNIDKEFFTDAAWSWDFGAGLDVLVFSVDVNYEVGINNFIPSLESTQNDILSITVGLTF